MLHFTFSFLHNHPIIAKLMGSSTFITIISFSDIEKGVRFFLVVATGSVTLGYTVWKWITEYREKHPVKKKRK
jgi:hypothetical protein